MKLALSVLIFEKFSKDKLHENPSRDSRVVPCGRTDRHDEDNSHIFHIFSKAYKPYTMGVEKNLYRNPQKFALTLLRRNFLLNFSTPVFKM